MTPSHCRVPLARRRYRPSMLGTTAIHPQQTSDQLPPHLGERLHSSNGRDAGNDRLGRGADHSATTYCADLLHRGILASECHPTRLALLFIVMGAELMIYAQVSPARPSYDMALVKRPFRPVRETRPERIARAPARRTRIRLHAIRNDLATARSAIQRAMPRLVPGRRRSSSSRSGSSSCRCVCSSRCDTEIASSEIVLSSG